MKNLYWGKTIGSILIILLLMPLGHALMIIMEHTLEPTTLQMVTMSPTKPIAKAE